MKQGCFILVFLFSLPQGRGGILAFRAITWWSSSKEEMFSTWQSWACNQNLHFGCSGWNHYSREGFKLMCAPWKGFDRGKFWQICLAWNCTDPQGEGFWWDAGIDAHPITCWVSSNWAPVLVQRLRIREFLQICRNIRVFFFPNWGIWGITQNLQKWSRVFQWIPFLFLCCH